MISLRSCGDDSDSSSKCRAIDIEENVTPLLSLESDPMASITFRPLEPKDRGQIQKLHEEWFPVSYKDEFYDDLVMHRMVNSGEELVTCAAVYQGDQNDHDIAVQSPSDHSIWGQINGHSGCGDSIVACIVGSKVDASNLSGDTVDSLLSDPTRHKRMFYIMTLGTVKEFRKLGLATKLLKKVMDMVQEDRECGTLYLHVITFNVAAIRFYEKLGFYRVKEMKNYYCIDNQTYNCYVYAKYYHGNHGQLDYYYLLTTIIASIWRRVTEPFMPAMLEAGIDRNR